MIFIPKHIVFIVGGRNLDTFYINLKEKRIVKWGNLNITRIEPALQIIKNKLYCISNFDDFNNYSLEVTDLTSNEGKWILIKPIISPNIIINQIYQKFFGICKDKEDNIIFLGGEINYDNINLVKNNMNFLYNILNNSIDFSQVKFKSFHLKEKGFSPFNNAYDFVLTDFPRESPQIAFYNKNKRKIEVINFSPNDILQKNITEDEKSNIHNKQKLDNFSNISPINFKKNNQEVINQKFNNRDLNQETFFSFDSKKKEEKLKQKVENKNANYIGLTNQSKKLNNNIAPINNLINNINPNLNLNRNININNKNTFNKLNNFNNLNNLERQNNFQKMNNQYLLNNLNKNIQYSNYALFNQVPILNNRNELGLYSLTPDKNYQFFNYNIYIPNNRTNYTASYTPNSFNSAHKQYYFPKGRLQNYQNNYYNNYNKKKYYY